ncbi:MAG TPA: MopE-related protein, partial [Myxococcota bacterium]|nr:MopE-related protein [Myxococcota bacterium]
YPGAPEVAADGVDQDCDGLYACWVDADQDGYGNDDGVTTQGADAACRRSGQSMIATDCDDAAALVHPGAAEIADDGVDQDCDGLDLLAPRDTADTDAGHDTDDTDGPITDTDEPDTDRGDTDDSDEETDLTSETDVPGGDDTDGVDNDKDPGVPDGTSWFAGGCQCGTGGHPGAAALLALALLRRRRR